MQIVLAIILVAVLAVGAIIVSQEQAYKQLETEVLRKTGLMSWDAVPYFDEFTVVKSRQALQKYEATVFFKGDRERLDAAERIIEHKNSIEKTLRGFLANNEFKSRPQYERVRKQVKKALINSQLYRIEVKYITSAGNNLGTTEIALSRKEIERFRSDPSLLMTKSEYNRYLKEQQKAALDEKHHEYYGKVNSIIDRANRSRDELVIAGDRDRLDGLAVQLFDRTVNSIKKIKTLDSEEWDVIGEYISHVEGDIDQILGRNRDILEYYDSPNFTKVKDACKALMSSQKEFNEYISEKVQSISSLFGCRTVRDETVNSDQNAFVRPYKKSITPFTAEVSAAVFASAENRPLEYVVKFFYPDKRMYPEQIRKLYLLVEELETLRDAKQIIDNYKLEYQQYLGDVPSFVMKNDESGFYSRLGFANIDEHTLVVDYKFVYTSGGGMAQRSFTVPMTEDTIIALIGILEWKLTSEGFAKEQRRLMTRKMRESIKARDKYTCCFCGNSVVKEPNLLLEIDHIIPIAKGGCTTEENLQTLCWRCNRSKGDKVVEA